MTNGINDGQGFDMNIYWRRTIYAAAGARIYRPYATHACDPDEAFTAGLAY